MRAVIQRVSSANVMVDESIVGEIKNGLVVLLGIGEEDTLEDIDYCVDKVVNLRIFTDQNDKMNLSLLDLKYELLIVSQFTLYGDCRKGRRPNFMASASAEKANKFYNMFVDKCRMLGSKVETGIFQAHMKVNIVNDGPVTIILDSKRNF